MENSIHINLIGSVLAENDFFCIKVDEKFRPALTNISGFSHLHIVWWGNLFDQPENRNQLVADKPYKKGPDKLGIFATRSPVRPNPILITTIFVQKMDIQKGFIYTPYIDAEPGSPVLDIKPYHLSERVKECFVPEWCSHWPEWYEDSGTFNWMDEFNY